MNRALTIIAAALACCSTVCACRAAVGSTEVKVALRTAATVTPDGSGFFLLGDIANVTGGSAAARNRIRLIEIGRAPIDNCVRRLNLGNVALKLRQSGIDPNTDVQLTGSPTTTVSCLAAPQVSNVSIDQPAYQQPVIASDPVAVKPVIVIHRNDPVTIVLQGDGLSITAVGQARDDGAVGDTIHVYRSGLTNDILVEVIDAHTVKMEMPQ